MVIFGRDMPHTRVKTTQLLCVNGHPLPNGGMSKPSRILILCTKMGEVFQKTLRLLLSCTGLLSNRGMRNTRVSGRYFPRTRRYIRKHGDDGGHIG